jgi:hypothetical protein
MQSNNVIVFQIKQYMIIWRQLELMQVGGTTIKLRALVRLIGDEYSMDVYFIEPDSAVPQPGFDVAQKKGYMCLPIMDIMPFVDMVRNEKPIYGHLRGDRPEWTSVTTSKEPVGEGNLDQS